MRVSRVLQRYTGLCWVVTWMRNVENQTRKEECYTWGQYSKHLGGARRSSLPSPSCRISECLLCGTASDSCLRWQSGRDHMQTWNVCAIGTDISPIRHFKCMHNWNMLPSVCFCIDVGLCAWVWVTDKVAQGKPPGDSCKASSVLKKTWGYRKRAVHCGWKKTCFGLKKSRFGLKKYNSWEKSCFGWE